MCVLLAQLFGVVLGVTNEAGAHWNVLAEGICLWEVCGYKPQISRAHEP